MNFLRTPLLKKQPPLKAAAFVVARYILLIRYSQGQTLAVIYNHSISEAVRRKALSA